MTDAPQLLRAWAEQGSDEAFGELVRRYLDLVWSVARRLCGGDVHAAEDIVQQVFTDLAAQARRGRGPLAGSPCALGGWLHRHTCFVAGNHRRAARRRQLREQIAAAMHLPDSAADPAWQTLAPVLDDTLNEQAPADRDALLLRFYERRDLRAVGEALGVSEDAAQKRVARALERLREWLVARDISLGVTGLAAWLGQHAVEAAPGPLLDRVCRAAAAAGAAGGLGWLAAVLATGKGQFAAAPLAGLIGLPLVWQFAGRNAGEEEAGGDAGGGQAALAAGGSRGAGAAGEILPLAPVAVSARGAGGEADPQALVLRFLAADTGEPVPNVVVKYQCWSGGEWRHDTLQATRAGVCEVHFPRLTATRLQLISQCEGYADTRLLWEPTRGEEVPYEYTVRLEPAVPIGGWVVDPEGQSVAGATVSFGHGEMPGAPRPQSHAFGWIGVETDLAGRWRINRIAGDMLGQIRGSARHPAFLSSAELDTTREAEAVKRLRAGEYVFQLGRGVTVRGVVVDRDDHPVVNALVRVGWVGYANIRETRTLADGSFEVTDCEPGRKPVTASAPGYAPTAIGVYIRNDTPPLRLVLQPAKPLRFQVVDPNRVPIPEAWFALNFLEGLHLHEVDPSQPLAPQVEFSGLTDAEGRAVWEDAPDQGLPFSFFKRGYHYRGNVRLRPARRSIGWCCGPLLPSRGWSATP